MGARFHDCTIEHVTIPLVWKKHPTYGSWTRWNYITLGTSAPRSPRVSLHEKLKVKEGDKVQLYIYHLGEDLSQYSLDHYRWSTVDALERWGMRASMSMLLSYGTIGLKFLSLIAKPITLRHAYRSMENSKHTCAHMWWLGSLEHYTSRSKSCTALDQTSYISYKNRIAEQESRSQHDQGCDRSGGCLNSWSRWKSSAYKYYS